MILHPIIDLLKRIVVALPDYAGGGSGGVQAPDLVQYEEITIAEDRLTTSTNGSTAYFQTQYLPDVTTSSIGYPTILIFVDNTFTGQYCAQGAIRQSNYNDSVNNGNPPTARYFMRDTGTIGLGNSIFFYTGAGTVLHKYVFVRAEQ